MRITSISIGNQHNPSLLVQAVRIRRSNQTLQTDLNVLIVKEITNQKAEIIPQYPIASHLNETTDRLKKNHCCRRLKKLPKDLSLIKVGDTNACFPPQSYLVNII